MATRRTINWSGTMHDIRSSGQVSPYLTPNGSFDLRAIMKAAIAEARQVGRRFRLPWTARLSMCLRFVWAKAKRAAVTARLSQRADHR
jgi:hypothetical protein